MNETNSKTGYEDIIEHSRPISTKHPRMRIADRAAQFSPFAALTGYEAAIKETERVTDKKYELSEDAKTVLNEKLQIIIDMIDEKPVLEFTYFVADRQKSGGAYIKTRGSVRKIDEYRRLVIVNDRVEIPIDDIFDIEGDIFGKSSPIP